MEYIKPKVEVLGNALQAIEQIGQKKAAGPMDTPHAPNPAYDLDE